ncbi:MAG: hypothetical protein ACR2MP_23915, partial [Streptosporangiaceae bacterium]
MPGLRPARGAGRCGVLDAAEVPSRNASSSEASRGVSSRSMTQNARRAHRAFGRRHLSTLAFVVV